jgi:hypothetical protein
VVISIYVKFSGRKYGETTYQLMEMVYGYAKMHAAGVS